MVAFCALAAIVTKVGFWLIAIIIAGRALFMLIPVRTSAVQRWCNPQFAGFDIDQ